MRLVRNSLQSAADPWQIPPRAHARVHGSYNPMQFAVRLDPEIDRILTDAGAGTPGNLQSKQIRAFATYLHETVHWWQHVGSTAGLMLSLSYPAQTHFNFALLQRLIEAVGPKKSLRRVDDLSPPGTLPHAAGVDLSRVLNNWHDLEFACSYMLAPRTAFQWAQDPYFDSVGHSFEMLWGGSISILATGVDPQHTFLPDPRTWEAGFDELRRKKVPGFFFGSQISLPPFGAREIFEAQARFAELHYLHFASGGVLDWEDFRRVGLLGRGYVGAFQWFLELIGEPFPDSVDHPLVGLFLVVCELAVNPTDAFPFDLRFYEFFINDVDPGTRFLTLSELIRREHRGLTRLVVDYSRQEYVEATEILSHEMVSPSPLIAAHYVADRSVKHSGLQRLLLEDERFEFGNQDLPIRLLFARYLRFQADKAQRPELFTWPGAWTTNRGEKHRALAEILPFFRRHEALFHSVPGGEIRPRLLAGRPEQNVQRMFDEFYAANVTYNLVRQWISADGAFDFDFAWLAPDHDQDEVRQWADRNFQQQFSQKPSEFVVL